MLSVCSSLTWYRQAFAATQNIILSIISGSLFVIRYRHLQAGCWVLVGHQIFCFNTRTAKYEFCSQFFVLHHRGVFVRFWLPHYTRLNILDLTVSRSSLVSSSCYLIKLHKSTRTKWGWNYSFLLSASKIEIIPAAYSFHLERKT